MMGMFPADLQSVIGDDLWDSFVEWADKVDKETSARVKWCDCGGRSIHLFTQWLLDTEAGNTALRRINGTPRQLFLPFEDERWKRACEQGGGMAGGGPA